VTAVAEPDALRRSRPLNWAPLLGGVAGVGLSAWLLKSYGVQRIGDLIAHAGWAGILMVVAFHGVQVVCSAWGWRVIASSSPPREPLRVYVVLRWIREAVNNLLPLAQIGGEVVAWRLLRHRGAALPAAIAGTVADLTLEMVTQIAFTLIGTLLLLRSVESEGIAATVMAGSLIAGVLMVVLFGALRLGLAARIEKGLLRVGRLMGWAGAAHVEGLNEALMSAYRQPGRVARSALWHLASWLLGAAEVCLALHFLGQDVSIESGLVIESIGQAAKALGFAVPGALGVQEEGYVIVCRAVGLSAELAIALSLIKRLREVALGIPAIVVWQHWETKFRAAPKGPLSEFMP
jgi:putative membrane protein